MKYLFSLIILFLTTISLAQSDEKIVAVFDHVGVAVTDDIKTVVREEISNVLKNSGIRVVEREAIAEVFKEHNIQKGGEIDDRQIVALGKKLGANYVCYAIITLFNSNYHFSCKLTKMLTAEVIFQETDITKNGSIDIIPIVRQLTNKITKKINPESEKKAEWPVGIWLDDSFKGIKYYLFEDGTGKFYNEEDGFTNYNVTWIINENTLEITKISTTCQECVYSTNWEYYFSLQEKDTICLKLLEYTHEDKERFVFNITTRGKTIIKGNKKFNDAGLFGDNIEEATRKCKFKYYSKIDGTNN